MALKRRLKVEAGFSMSSMTDIIFLLLLFFIMASTMSSPNDIKINLPQSRAATSTKALVAKVSIDEDGNYFIAEGNQRPYAVAPELLEASIVSLIEKDTTTYISLHADQKTMYEEIVRVLDIANQHKLKLVIATKSAQKK
jgi:biopolymer transport protein ExbD